MNWPRVVAAFLVAPIAGSTTSFLIGVMTGLPPEYIFPFLPIAAIVGLACEVVFGVPLLLVGYRLGYTRLPLFLVGGLLAAFAFASLYFFTESGITIAWFLTMVLCPAVVASIVLWFAGGWSSNQSFERTGLGRRGSLRSGNR
jgi:hypothetical protein